MVNYTKQVTILYVEDEENVRAGYERALNRYCKELYIAKDGVEGLELYKQNSPDIVISDIKMPHKNGIEMARDILSINENQAIIFTTAHTESEYTIEALNLQVDGYLIKPVDKKKLKAKLEHLAKNIIVMKRGRGKGYAGIENELFFGEKTRMLFGHAKDSLHNLTNDIKSL